MVYILFSNLSYFFNLTSYLGHFLISYISINLVLFKAAEYPLSQLSPFLLTLCCKVSSVVYSRVYWSLALTPNWSDLGPGIVRETEKHPV